MEVSAKRARQILPIIEAMAKGGTLERRYKSGPQHTRDTNSWKTVDRTTFHESFEFRVTRDMGNGGITRTYEAVTPPPSPKEFVIKADSIGVTSPHLAGTPTEQFYNSYTQPPGPLTPTGKAEIEEQIKVLQWLLVDKTVLVSCKAGPEADQWAVLNPQAQLNVHRYKYKLAVPNHGPLDADQLKYAREEALKLISDTLMRRLDPGVRDTLEASRRIITQQRP